MSAAKKKIAIVVQRYGQQINGGAEALARMLAEKLIANYDVTVLTSRAIDYHTWQPVLKEGVDYENDVKIIRFDHGIKNFPADKEQHKRNRENRGRLLYQKIYRLIGKPKWYLGMFPGAQHKGPDLKEWVKYQGPAMLKLIPYLQKNKDEYAAFIFFTYLYYPTVYGLGEVAEKSILIPTMHDEKAAYEPVFQEIMQLPAYLMFLTESEKRFSNKQFDISHIPNKVISVGIDVPEISEDREIIKRLGVKHRYILYVGRIEAHKGCGELLNYFQAFKAESENDIQLVFAGKNSMDAVVHPDIIYAGFVSDEEKWQLMKQAEALVIPSKYESLSLVLLESFAYKVPVLVNGECEVLKDHIEISKGGLLYYDESGFKASLSDIVKGTSNKAMGESGYRYVKENYNWEKVMHAFDQAIDLVSNGKG